jgi:hypothetical protein
MPGKGTSLALSLKLQAKSFLQKTFFPRAQADLLPVGESQAPAPAPISTPAPVSLTAINSEVLRYSGLQTQTQPKRADCDCAKPVKVREKKKFACSNPLVSRYVKDGEIIIKRKLVCPPSSRKSR